MKLRIPTTIALLAAALLQTACTGASLQTPSGFAKLEDQEEYDYRATSAAGVVVAVRAEDNNPEGNLDFWVAAVDKQLRRGGYQVEGAERAVQSSAGVPGRELHYTRNEGGRSYRFWVAVFVTEDKVFVVEAGGDASHFDKATNDRVSKAIASAKLS